jgi:hypothetical protein
VPKRRRPPAGPPPACGRDRRSFFFSQTSCSSCHFFAFRKSSGGMMSLVTQRRAKRSAPGPTSRTWSERSITLRAALIGCLTMVTSATAPALWSSPRMMAASSEACPSWSSTDPVPASKSPDASMTRMAASTPSRLVPPSFFIALSPFLSAFSSVLRYLSFPFSDNFVSSRSPSPPWMASTTFSTDGPPGGGGSARSAASATSAGPATSNDRRMPFSPRMMRLLDRVRSLGSHGGRILTSPPSAASPSASCSRCSSRSSRTASWCRSRGPTAATAWPASRRTSP